MRIGDYDLTGDAFCWTVCRIATVQDKASKNHGEEMRTDHRYYPRLEQALSHLIDAMLRDDPAANLDDLSAKIKSVRSLVVAARAAIGHQRATRDRGRTITPQPVALDA